MMSADYRIWNKALGWSQHSSSAEAKSFTYGGYILSFPFPWPLKMLPKILFPGAPSLSRKSKMGVWDAFRRKEAEKVMFCRQNSSVPVQTLHWIQPIIKQRFVLHLL